MTRVQTHDLETAPPQSADALKSLDNKYGTTLNNLRRDGQLAGRAQHVRGDRGIRRRTHVA